MSPFEDQLRHALRRKNPPAGFAERVRERIEAAPARPVRWRKPVSQMPMFRWAAAGLAALVLIVTLAIVRQSRERRRQAQAELAGRQAVLALRIASAKLNGALKEVKRVDRARPAPGQSKSTRAMEKL